MSENRAWAYLRPKLVSRVVAKRIHRAQQAGVPDLILQRNQDNFLYEETREKVFHPWCAWLEMKYVKEEHMKHKLKISSEQVLWIWQWNRNGGNSGVLVRTARKIWVLFIPDYSTDWTRLIAQKDWYTNPDLERYLFKEPLTPSAIQDILTLLGYPRV